MVSASGESLVSWDLARAGWGGDSSLGGLSAERLLSIVVVVAGVHG